MNKEDIFILYIDDKIDIGISRFLNEKIAKQICNDFKKYINNCEIMEVEFLPEYTIKDILFHDSIGKSNIILIDSRLFLNSNQEKPIFGEQISTFIKILSPYKEIIIVTQNEIDTTSPALSKYKKVPGKNQQDYYIDEWTPKILDKVKNVLMYRSSISGLKDKEYEFSVILEQIENSLSNHDDFNHLKPSDIDNLIEMFQKLESKIDNFIKE